MAAYVTVDEAKTYFAGRLNTAPFMASPPEQQAAALEQATRDLDRLRWRGQKADPNQPNAWPRVFPRTTSDYGAIWASEAITPQEIKDATCEQALFLLSLTPYEWERRRQHVLGMVGGSVGSANEYSALALVQEAQRRPPMSPEALALVRRWLAGAVTIC